MMALQSALRQFQAALLADQPPMAGLLSPRGDAQFGIYLNAYRARLHGALRENYEVLALVMGDDDFDALARAYIDAEPSRHYSLRWFGHALPDLMVQRDDLVPHPAMWDVARMEWALRTAFDAASAPAWTPEVLATLPPENWPALQFALHPSVQLLPMQWAVGPVWHALKQGNADVPAPEALDHALLVWRDGSLHTQWKTATAPEAAFVRCLQQRHHFGQVCETLAATAGEAAAAQTAAALLRGFLETGVVCGLHATAPEA